MSFCAVTVDTPRTSKLLLMVKGASRRVTQQLSVTKDVLKFMTVKQHDDLIVMFCLGKLF